MRQRIKAYAPKDKTYCSTTSLATLVEIAGVAQVAGNHSYWKSVYGKKNLVFDTTLSNHLKSIDDKKESQMRGHQQKRGNYVEKKNNWTNLTK